MRGRRVFLRLRYVAVAAAGRGHHRCHRDLAAHLRRDTAPEGERGRTGREAVPGHRRVTPARAVPSRWPSAQCRCRRWMLPRQEPPASDPWSPADQSNRCWIEDRPQVMPIDSLTLSDGRGPGERALSRRSARSWISISLGRWPRITNGSVYRRSREPKPGCSSAKGAGSCSLRRDKPGRARHGHAIWRGVRYQAIPDLPG
jgi:hypothetical protein